MGGAGSQESSSESRTFLPIQQKYLRNALNIYGPLLGKGYEGYPGERVAGLTPEQQGVLGNLGSYADYFGGAGTMPLYGETGTTLRGLLGGQFGAQPLSGEQALQTFQQTREAPALKYWKEYTKPATQEAYAGPGFWGSSQAKAVGKSASDLGANLASQRAGYLWDVEETNRQLTEAKAARQLGAVPLAQQYGTMPTQEMLSRLGGMGTVFDFMDIPRQMQQQQINTEIAKWAEEQQITDPQVLNVVMSLLGMNYGSSSSSSSGWNAYIGAPQSGGGK